MSKLGGRDGLPADVKEFFEMVVAYARQETVEPLKGLARYVAFGIAGSVVLGFGLTLLLLGGLRLLQSETGSVFAGRWSWVPYFLTLLVALGVAALALVGRGGRGADASGAGGRP